MKLNTAEFKMIRDTWTRFGDPKLKIGAGVHYDEVFKVINKNGETVPVTDWYYVWKDPNSSKLAFRVQKDYWAKGRKLKIESKVDTIVSGEYVIVSKAQSNSYDTDNFLVVEHCTPALDTPRKTLNWLEKQVADLEARDGVTVDTLAREIRAKV